MFDGVSLRRAESVGQADRCTPPYIHPRTGASSATREGDRPDSRFYKLSQADCPVTFVKLIEVCLVRFWDP